MNATPSIAKPVIARAAMVIALAFSAAWSARPVWGAELTSARLTEVVKDVNLLAESGQPRTASVGDTVRGRVAVATGRRSRAELQFNDNTLLRLGANTTFSLAGGSRVIELREGAVLIQTAPGTGGISIRAGSVTAAITGSLGLFSVSPPADPKLADQERMVKFISIHGTMSMEVGGVVYKLQPFEMLFFRVDLEGNLIGQPIIKMLDGEKLVKSSKLINGFDDGTRVDRDEILAQLNQQGGEKKDNDWTVVRSDLNHGQILGASQHATIGLNALIKPFLPPPPPPPLPRPPPPPPKPRPPAPPPPPPQQNMNYNTDPGNTGP